MKRLRICHITTVHPTKDMRIFHKECQTLYQEGHEVFLIVNEGQEESRRRIEGIEVQDLKIRTKNRLERIWKVARQAYRQALELDADIYHFHDPEFLPFAKRLVKKGHWVFYDVHEDVPRQILSKHYIPRIIRKAVARLFESYEDRISKRMSGIIAATDHIRERFAKRNAFSYSVKNFPILDKQVPASGVDEGNSKKLCYIGSITRVRGIPEVIKALPSTDAELDLAGSFHPPDLREELAGYEGWKQVNELGFVEREEASRILRGSMAGIVTLHPIINYLHALPVKMFEYMAAGLPVIASDFPVLKAIIQEHDCGICVDPYDPEAIAEAVRSITENPEWAKQMGENGKRAAHSTYNWEKEAHSLLEAYREVLGPEGMEPKASSGKP